MEAIHIRQRLRPSRHAFIVREGDFGAALQSASLNTALWGGIYNPIVLLEPAEEREGILREFDPDLLVNLTGAELPADLASRYQHRIIAADQLVRVNDRTGGRGLAFGFHILPIIRHVYEKEVRFFTGPSRATLPVPDQVRGWPEFVTFVYGSFAWLPPLDQRFEESFVGGLRAKTPTLAAVTPLPNHEDHLLPLSFTAYGLRHLGGLANFSSHIVYIGDHLSLTDLIEFWNIRSTGRAVVFVPVAGYRAFEPVVRSVAERGHYPINEQVQNNADLQKGPSISEALFDEVCDWFDGLGVGQLPRRNWRPRFGMKADFYFGDIHAADVEASDGEEISILQDRAMTPVKLIPPPYLEESGLHSREFAWSVEITMMGGYLRPEFMFSFPHEPAIEPILRRSASGMPGKVRLGRGGLVLLQEWPRDTLSLQPIRTDDVFNALFQQAGLEAEPSEPGRYAEQIIKKMGSIYGDCRVFKIRGVRDILDRLGDGSILTKGNMYGIVLSETPDQYGQNWRQELYQDLYVRSGQRQSLDFGTIFDVLLQNRVIRPGFMLRCGSCFKEDWYHVSEFSEEYTCRFCFDSQRVDFGSKHEWQYKGDGLFQIPDSAQGSVAAILSLWRLEDLAHFEGRYATARKLAAKGSDRRYEIDFAYILVETFSTSYDLVLGEAKRFGDLTDEDVTKMAELADRFSGKPYLAFSTLKDLYSDAEKVRLRALAERGYKVIAFTREELDPYWLYERFKSAPHPHASTLKDLSENTVHLNVRQ